MSFTFDPRDVLSLQIGFRFVRATVACAVLKRTSGLKSSSETTAPRYLKLVTVPSFCSFTFISLWMPLAPFVISLVFSAVVSILYLVQVLSRLSTRASSSCSSSARASMSSANRRLVLFLPPMLTLPSSWVRYPVWQHTFFSPSAFSRRAVVSYWRKYVHGVLVNRLEGLSLPRKSVVRLTDRPDMTLNVYRGRKTTKTT